MMKKGGRERKKKKEENRGKSEGGEELGRGGAAGGEGGLWLPWPLEGGFSKGWSPRKTQWELPLFRRKIASVTGK